MDIVKLLTLLGPAAAPALALFVVALYRRDIVLGWSYTELAQDRDFWRDLAWKGLNTAETSTSTAETLIKDDRR